MNDTATQATPADTSVGVNSCRPEGNGVSVADGPHSDKRSSGPVSTPQKVETPSPGSDSVDEWFELVHPDFAHSNAFRIAGAAKLIDAKRALKKRKGSFIELVAKLDMDLDKAERLMKIARHPVLRDSAHARNLPTAWTTIATLAALPPEILLEFIASGTVHPCLQRKEAERLVQQARQSNSRRTKTITTDTHDILVDTAEPSCTETISEETTTSVETTSTESTDTEESKALPKAETLAQANDDIGPNSRLEIERKLERAEELERENCRLTKQVKAYECRIEELEGKVGIETNIPHQRRLSRNALAAIQKAETFNISDKEKRFLANSAISDLTELVRSAVRDGLKLDRFDLFYRPELH